MRIWLARDKSEYGRALNIFACKPTDIEGVFYPNNNFYDLDNFICIDDRLFPEIKAGECKEFELKELDKVIEFEKEIQDLKDTIEYVEKNKNELENLYQELMEQDLAELKKENEELKEAIKNLSRNISNEDWECAVNVAVELTKEKV
jgi:hypothetical protein